jgi:hypothetical protein
MTLWSEFLSRLLLGATLSGPPMADLAEEQATPPPAEQGQPLETRRTLPGAMAQAPKAG